MLNMLRSKSRSGYFDFGQKRHSSVLSRSISASKFCRGDALVSQVDKAALISVERNPSKVVHLSENRIVKASTMQQRMGDLEAELKRTKEQLGAAEEERDRVVDGLRETTMKLSEALSRRKAGEVFAELKTVKHSLSNSERELAAKDKYVEALKVELESAKLELAEREASLDRTNQDLSDLKASEADTVGLLSESNKRIEELEAEVERGKLAESKMFESVMSQTKQLEQTKIKLEESKLEMASLHDQMEKFQRNSSNILNGSHTHSGNIEYSSMTEEAFENLKSEMGLLKNELKLATEAEEKSKKAMDDLASALKEVATEANQAKEKLGFTEVELEHVKGEAEQLKKMVRSIEDKYEKLLDEAKKEKELHQNTGDRLRLEAEESLLAWNGKEMGFVSCIKRAEEEKALALHENARLIETLKAAENTTRTAREESYKLRDILKQALNEANVAKEAASIARAENSELKDYLTEKDEALHFLTRENERLRINEAAANENIKELKRLLSKTVEDKEQGDIFNSPDSSLYEEHVEERELKKGFSFDLNEIKIYNKHEDIDEVVDEEDPEKAEALKGSIFDNTVSPKSEPQTPKPGLHHRRDSSSAFTDGGGTPNLEDFDHLHDDADDRNSHKRRLFRRIGDLINRKSFHKKEPSTE